LTEKKDSERGANTPGRLSLSIYVWNNNIGSTATGSIGRIREERLEESTGAKTGFNTNGRFSGESPGGGSS